MHHDHVTWEYTSVHLDIDHLNELGAAGWELVAVSGAQAILKRPRPDLREIVTADQRQHVYAARFPETGGQS
jgi:hypothetical protein